VNGPSERRCAVVYNPIKASDDLREAIARQATATGWEDAIWLETPAENPGPAITERVVSAGVDRVITAGGDGTVRIVADRLAETGIPMAVVPLGTGICWLGTSTSHCRRRRLSRWHSETTPETSI
jgi:diacylglycerol kinase (ATP)